MHWEYVALPYDAKGFLQVYCDKGHKALITEGWEEWLKVPWYGRATNGVSIMRRPKDEPRKWTEKELERLWKVLDNRATGVCEALRASGIAYDPESVRTGLES